MIRDTAILPADTPLADRQSLGWAIFADVDRTLTPEQVLPYEKLVLLVRLDAESGKLFWLPRPIEMLATPRAKAWNARFGHKPIYERANHEGYLTTRINGRHYKLHRMVWALVNGGWPDGIIDHINGRVDDNRPENLRVVDPALNARNRKLSRRNKTGHNGVGWSKQMRRYTASITVDGEHTHLGSFVSIEDAIRARKNAEQGFGFGPNHGKVS